MPPAMGTPLGPASTPDLTGTRKISLYEQTREDRIRENKERLQKLGIVDLSEKLRSSGPKRTLRRRVSADVRPTPVLPPAPTRRSSRLQNATPVSYTDGRVYKKRGRGSENKDIVLEVGSKPEIYTEEHDKLLGYTERSWELFIDGYGKDGRRIYDPIKGKTCHQCRQKTLGHRTQCCKCNMLQGQFCGDCLYMRYGEHVLEALENPNWMCPVCRGICNCSLCRQARGWPPTGPLYKKVSRLGYKSVAHFLVQTRRAEENEETLGSDCHPPVKRSLPFSETEEAVTQGSLEPDKDENKNSDSKIEQEGKDGFHVKTKRPLSFSSKVAVETLCNEENANGGVLDPEVEGKAEEHKSKDEQEVSVTGKTEEHKSEDVQEVGSITEENAKATENGNSDVMVKDNDSELEVFVNGFGKSEERKIDDEQAEGRAVEKENRAKPKRRCAVISTEAGGDSIGARLRQRRRMQSGN